MTLPSAYGEESPEALRRRADVLLDEMMLGGVDTASAGPHTGNGATHWPQAGEVGLEYDGAGYGANGASSGFDAHDANGYYAPAESSAPAAPNGGQPPVSPSQPGSGRLISAEERYAQFTGARPASQPSAQQNSLRQPASAPQPSVSLTETFTTTSNPAVTPLQSGTGDGWQPANSAVRRQSPSLASTMSVGVRAARRSVLVGIRFALPACGRVHSHDPDCGQLVTSSLSAFASLL